MRKEVGTYISYSKTVDKAFIQRRLLHFKRIVPYNKNLTNEAIYNIRQYYFTKGKFLDYVANYHLLKFSQNYKMLRSNMA